MATTDVYLHHMNNVLPLTPVERSPALDARWTDSDFEKFRARPSQASKTVGIYCIDESALPATLKFANGGNAIILFGPTAVTVADRLARNHPFRAIPVATDVDNFVAQADELAFATTGSPAEVIIRGFDVMFVLGRAIATHGAPSRIWLGGRALCRDADIFEALLSQHAGLSSVTSLNVTKFKISTSQNAQNDGAFPPNQANTVNKPAIAHMRS